MSMTKLRVHIAPVGFEVDRIVLPAIDMRADRIWLLTHEEKNDSRVRLFETQIVKKLKKANIEIKSIESNRKVIFKILPTVKRIIKQECDHDIYVNASSGSKIQAIACMMACMMFNEKGNIKPYYAEPKKYPQTKEQQSVGLKEILEFPKYHIQIPDQKLVQALQIIKKEGNKITKKKMANVAKDENLITAKEVNREQSLYASLDRNIIRPLEEEWGYVKVERIGRSRVIKLTQEGEDALEFLI